MRPTLTNDGQAAMTRLGASGPQGSDPFETMVAGKVTMISMELERTNAKAASLREDLEVTEARLKVLVGEYQGWGEALAGYYQSQQTGQQTHVAAPGGCMPMTRPPEPTLAATEAAGPKGVDGPTDPAPDSDGHPGQPKA